MLHSPASNRHPGALLPGAALAPCGRVPSRTPSTRRLAACAAIAMLALTLPLAPACAADASSDDPPDPVEQARELIRADDHAAAAGLLRDLLAGDPNHDRAVEAHDHKSASGEEIYSHAIHTRANCWNGLRGSA